MDVGTNDSSGNCDAMDEVEQNQMPAESIETRGYDAEGVVVNEDDLHAQNDAVNEDLLNSQEDVIAPLPSQENIMNEQDLDGGVMIESLHNVSEDGDHVDAVSVSAVSDDSGIQDTIQLDEDAFTNQRMAWCPPEERDKEQIYLQHQGLQRGQLRGRGQPPPQQLGFPRHHSLDQQRWKPRYTSYYEMFHSQFHSRISDRQHCSS